MFKKYLIFINLYLKNFHQENAKKYWTKMFEIMIRIKKQAKLLEVV